jgi:hypothetical protein
VRSSRGAKAETLRREKMRDANARVPVLVKPDVAAECPAEFGSTLRLFRRRRWWAGRQRDIIVDEGLPLL